MSTSKKSKKHKKCDKQQKLKKPQKGERSSQRAKPKKHAVLRDRVCPCCKKRCPLTKPKCSKGKAVRAKLLRDAGLAQD